MPTLISKITSRITCWSSKFLSYAGLLQLIKVVISSMQSYWSQIFLLPQKVIKLLNPYVEYFCGQGRLRCQEGPWWHGIKFVYPKLQEDGILPTSIGGIRQQLVSCCGVFPKRRTKHGCSGSMGTTSRTRT